MWWVQTECPGTSGQGGVDRPRFSLRVTHSWPSQQGPPALTLTPTWGTSWGMRSPNLTRRGPPSFVLPLGLPAAVAGCVPENQKQRYRPRFSLAKTLPTPKSTGSSRDPPQSTPSTGSSQGCRVTAASWGASTPPTELRAPPHTDLQTGDADSALVWVQPPADLP